MSFPSTTPLTEIEPDVIATPFREVRNPNASGAGSIHDTATAQKLGFRGGTVAGSNHMDLFAPLATKAWGKAWWETGSLSLYFRNATLDREPVSARMKTPARDHDTQADVWMNREDGMLVCEGTVSVGDAGEPSALRRLDMATIDPAGVRILEKLHPGDLIPETGAIYSGKQQEDRLGITTEPMDWYRGDSPWGGPIVTPAGYVGLLYGQAIRSLRLSIGKVVGLFGAIEIRNVNGPLLVDTPYVVHGKVLAVGQSPKTEFFWYETYADDTSGKRIAEHRMLLRFMKASSPLWAE
ncbi:MAG: hypothetical protein U0547_14980 [Dehalococcoidia bacterium]